MNRKHLAVLALLGLAVYFLGNWGAVVTDPVESNYTETAREMLAAGDWLSPRIYGNYWYDKPVFFYWELLISYSLFGINDFAARFFPALLSVAAIFLTYWFTRRLYEEKLAFVASLLFGTSVGCWYVGHAIITDMTLYVAECLTLIGFYLGYTEKKPGWWYLAFVAAAVGVLTKGPIGLCMPGLIILVFLVVRRDLKALVSPHILLGLVLFTGLCALWYYPMYLRHGSDFIDTFLGVHNVMRAKVAEHPRDNVWYFYLLVYLAAFCPYSLMTLRAGLRKLWRREVHLPRDPRTQFLSLWAFLVFAVFECFATKYVTYTFPWMLPLSIFLARYFVQHETMFRRTWRTMAVLYVVLMFAAVPQSMRSHSGWDVGQRLLQLKTPETKIYFYRMEWSASLIYYTNLEVKELQTEEEQEKRSEQKEEEAEGAPVGWDAKDVMPMATIDEIRPEDDVIVVSDDRHRRGRHPVPLEQIQQELPGKWEKVCHVRDFVLYRHLPQAPESDEEN
jgi:4-amino-4-deoxy-L-arabinose transferase-like glycosyltransferase